MIFSGDTRTITRPDYVPPWSGRQVVPWLTLFFSILGVLCVFGTGLPFVAIFFELFADACWVLAFLSIVYTIWVDRYWLRYIVSRDRYRCLLSPRMDEWFYNRQVFTLTGMNKEKCIVPVATVKENRIKIVVLPNTLKALVDSQFATELEAYMHQHGCQVSILPGQRRGGYVFYTIRPNVREDRLSYGK